MYLPHHHLLPFLAQNPPQLTIPPQICIGKHITNTEMYKLLPNILRDFEFDMHLNGKAEWNVWAGWFYSQKDVWCSVRRRRGREGADEKGGRAVVEVPADGWRGE